MYEKVLCPQNLAFYAENVKFYIPVMVYGGLTATFYTPPANYECFYASR